MFDHITIFVTNHESSARFYEHVLVSLGHFRLYDLSSPEGNSTGFGKQAPSLWIKQSPAGAGHAHLAFTASSRHEVDAFHEAALRSGGKDNGPPGYRAHYHKGYYAAFAFDLDGNNIEAVFHDPVPL